MINKLMSVVLFVLAVLVAPLVLFGRWAWRVDAPAGRPGRLSARVAHGSVAMRRAWFDAPMRSSQWDELLLPVIYKWFDVGRTLRASLRGQLFNEQNSTRAYEESIGHGGISGDAWDTYSNSGQVGVADFNKGYKTRYTHGLYPIRIEIERTLLEDDQYGVIGQYGQKLGISAETKMERDAASVFNNAFSTDFKGGDGKPLCSTTHPKNPNKSGDLVNAGTDALTKDAVRDTRVAMMNTVDDAGNILGMVPDTILTPPELEDTALEIVNSIQDPTSANNAINPQAGRFQVVPWHHLTDSNNWFMIDSAWMGLSLNWYNRVGFEMMMTEENSVKIVYEGRMRYSYGWDDWRWVYGHNVS